MTREKAIENFRAMWHWMADKSEKSKRKVAKIEYFRAHHYDELKIPKHYCFLCEYANDEFFLHGGDDECYHCPIDFRTKRCTDADENGTCIYNKWWSCPQADWKEAARLCREIAELPEKEDT